MDNGMGRDMQEKARFLLLMPAPSVVTFVTPWADRCYSYQVHTFEFCLVRSALSCKVSRV